MRLEYFQMIDRIVQLDIEGRRIVAESHLPLQSPVFEGHFPGYAIMPGVLLIETMAQAGGWLILGAGGCSRMPFLMQVEKAKLRGFVAPGRSLQTEAELVHEGSGYAVAQSTILSGGKKVAEAEIRYGIMAFPNEILKGAILDSAGRLGLTAFFAGAAFDGA